MTSSPPPFSRFEWMIAWRYLRARRAEGGVSVMTWISLLGITLAVAALIITLAVRAGFRMEFVDTILGANAHVTVYQTTEVGAKGQASRAIEDYEAMAERLRAVPGVTQAAPLVKGEVLTTYRGRSAPAQVHGISADDLNGIPRIASPQNSNGDLQRFEDGIAIGWEIARQLGVQPGERIKLISPNGVRTAFGTS
ncbi:MAG: ABC transporter permease, partial [Pseudomonadota bacterium]